MQLQIINIDECLMRSAYILINTAPGKMETVLEKVKGIKGVQEAYMIYGVYDIIAEVKAGSIEDLKALVLNIRTLKYLRSSLTLHIVI
jgi:DNA-binding Lrp family transcriptional regulator